MQRGARGLAAEDDEMNLHVGRRDRRAGAEEAAGVAGADREQALSQQQVAQSGDDAAAPAVDHVVHRDRLGAAILHADLQMVLQIGADARHVGDHLDAQRAQQRRPVRRPESCMSCGELNAPPARITSRLAWATCGRAALPVFDADRAPVRQTGCGSPAHRLRRRDWIGGAPGADSRPRSTSGGRSSP